MIKIVCIFALIAVVASMPQFGQYGPQPVQAPLAPMRLIVKRDAVAAVKIDKNAPVQDSAVEAQDDMEKAETFGFGFHKVIHVGVPLYPSFYHYPLYYPGYHGYGYGYGYY